MPFEALDAARHDRGDFDCGVDALNLYLRQYANQDQKRSLTRVYVLSTGATVIGYYSLSSHSVPRDNLPHGIKMGGYGDIPFLLLGRLAVDKHYQGQGYGDALIMDAFRRTRDVAQQVGVFGMIVEAKDDMAARFYEGFGFKRLSSSAQRLVLPMTAINPL